MKKDLTDIFSSKKLTVILLIIYALLLGGATFIEKYFGTDTAKDIIYYSPLFIALHAFMVINFILITIKEKLFRYDKIPYLIIHFSLLLILTGAMVTHLFGKEGIIHIREGEESKAMVIETDRGREIEKLPFSIQLKDFRLTRYPGSKSPSSYESFVIINSDGEIQEEKIYMNNVLDLKGYRLFQASYDEDEKGTILSVNHDMAGRLLTYAGYGILFIGLLAGLFDKNSRFRRQWRKLNKLSLIIIFLIGGSCIVKAERTVVSREHAEKFGMLPIQSSNGRIIPLSTFASQIDRKFDAEKIVGGITSEQLLLEITAYPEEWCYFPLIEIKSKEICDKLHCRENRVSYADAFDENGNYILHSEVENIYMKEPSERSRADKQILKTDEKLNLFHSLITHQIIRIYPCNSDTSSRWLTLKELVLIEKDTTEQKIFYSYIQSVRQACESGDWSKADEYLLKIKQNQKERNKQINISENKLRYEVLYNKLELLKICKTGYIACGVLMVILGLMFKIRSRNKSLKYIIFSLLIITICFFIVHTASLSIRWYISGHAPWSNSYETMVFLGWSIVLCGFIFVRKNIIVSSLATLFGGIVLFVSQLNWMDPQITPLVPVLKSPWLMFHVATLVLAYGFLGVSCILGMTNLILSAFNSEKISKQITQLTIINELSMTLGLGLLSIGIFLGAIWANESWGRYWSWDPKETWALITLVVYSIILHVRWFAGHKNDRIFNLLSQMAILSILMTFLGVNYFFSGMHSYGNSEALSNFSIPLSIAIITVFSLPGIISYVFRRKS